MLCELYRNPAFDLFHPEELASDVPGNDAAYVGDTGEQQHHQIGIFVAQGPQDSHIHRYNTRKTLTEKENNRHSPLRHFAEYAGLDGIKIDHVGSDQKNHGGEKGQEKYQAQHIFSHKAIASGSTEVVVNQEAAVYKATLAFVAVVRVGMVIFYGDGLW